MDRHAPDGLRDDVVQAEADCTRTDPALARPRPAGLRGDGALRGTSTPRTLAMAGRLCVAHDGLYMQTHVAENTDEVRWVGRAVPRGAQLPRRLRPPRPAEPALVLAHGIWLDDHRPRACCASAARRSPSARAATCSWAAGCSTGRPRRDSRGPGVDGQRRGRRHQPVDAAHAGRWLQGAGAARLAPSAWTALHAATLGAAQALGLDAEIGHLGAGPWPTWRCGTGQPGRWPGCGTRWPAATCRRWRHRTLHARVFAWMTLSDERNLAGRDRFLLNRPLVLLINPRGELP
jgi:guanine deaminase